MSLQSFQSSYETNPITLVGGVAAQVPGGGMISIINYLQAPSFTTGVLGGANVGPDQFFAKFKVLSGGTLIENEIGLYPFANQQVAANAIIVQPLRISLLMICPAQGAGGWASKTALMHALQATLAQHSITGGSYTVATPVYIYNNCLLTSLKDVSDGSSEQPQWRFQWDFIQPLLTQQQAQMAQGALMSKATAGTQQLPNSTTGALAWSSPQNTVGQPSAGATSTVMPSSGASSGIQAAAVLPGSTSNPTQMSP